jgi:hypothetical protein
MQIGSVVQYRTSNGSIRPGMLIAQITPFGNFVWSLVFFSGNGTAMFAANAANDPTLSANNTFAVISPF